MAASSAEQISPAPPWPRRRTPPQPPGRALFRGDAYSIGETPCVVLRRIGTRNEIAAFENAQATTEFDLECFVSAGEGTETAADALHLAAHAVLMADATLASLWPQHLACTGTECETDRMDREVTRLTAHYTIDSWVLQGDLSTAL